MRDKHIVIISGGITIKRKVQSLSCIKSRT